MRWMERLNELQLTIEYREGPLHVVADDLSRRPQSDQLYLSDHDAALCNAWLKSACLQFTLKQCVDAAVASLHAGCDLAYLRCPKCSCAHLDEGNNATK